MLYGLGDTTFYKISLPGGTISPLGDWCVPYALGLGWDGTALWNISGPVEILGDITGGDGKAHKIGGLTLSVDQQKNEQEVSLFPNPTEGRLVVKGKQIEAVEIYSITGSLVYSKYAIGQRASVEIDATSLSKGVYFAKVYGQAGTLTKKLIIE